MLPIAHNSTAKLKACAKCRQEKPNSLHYFYKDKKTKLHKDICKDCTIPRGKARSNKSDVLKRYSVDQNGCWIYTHKFSQYGYGVFYYQGSTLKAHRVAYELLVGPIENGKVLDHLCGVKSCINPEHLEAIDQRENSQRWFKNYKHCETCNCKGEENS